MEKKAIYMRVPKELHTQLKETVAYLETDMTAFVLNLISKEVEKVLNKRDIERQSK